MFLAQLSYFRTDPSERPAQLPRSLLAASILMIVLGLLCAWVPLYLFVLSPHFFARAWRLPDVASAQWAVVFIGVAIAVGRYRRWSRPLLLGVVPAYIMFNITQVIFDICLSQRFIDVAAMALAIFLFIWFCLPQIGAAFTGASTSPSPSQELPLSLASWAIACITFSLFSVANVVMLLSTTSSHQQSIYNLRFIGFQMLSVLSGVGGFLTLYRRRFGVAVATLALFTQAVCLCFQIATDVEFYRQLPPQKPGTLDHDMATAVVASDVVRTALILAAAIFGIYVARRMKHASAAHLSV